jgi:hypothetical protein
MTHQKWVNFRFCGNVRYTMECVAGGEEVGRANFCPSPHSLWLHGHLLHRSELRTMAVLGRWGVPSGEWPLLSDEHALPSRRAESAC